MLRALLIGLAAGGHVGPGGEQDEGAGQPAPGLAELMGEHQGQVAAGGVAGHHHVPGAVALVHQVSPRPPRRPPRRRGRGAPAPDGIRRSAPGNRYTWASLVSHGQAFWQSPQPMHLSSST